MSNNKQQTAVEKLESFFRRHCNPSVCDIEWNDFNTAFLEAKEKYEHEMCVFADEYASYILDQSKLGIKGAMVSMCAWTFFKNRRNEQQ